MDWDKEMSRVVEALGGRSEVTIAELNDLLPKGITATNGPVEALLAKLQEIGVWVHEP